jgi:uncharacterized protein
VSPFLADGNVLIALAVVEHVHHGVALNWFEEEQPTLATCPITEGTLIRFLLREGRSAVAAMAVLDVIRSHDWHVFWPDAIPLTAAHLVGVIGHRQVTDAYLVALACHNNGHVVTLDKGLASMHSKHVRLLA